MLWRLKFKIMKNILKIKLLAIFILTEISSNAQYTQRFLGTYSITEMCNYGAPNPFLHLEKRIVVVEEGIDSDLLIHFLYWHDSIKAFILNDSSFVIPEQRWMYYSDAFGYEFEDYLYGTGKIRDDSICLSYGYGTFAFFDEYPHLIFNAGCDNCREGSTNIVLLPAKQNKVYYNAINQTIIIDEALQNQSLTLELYDMQGKMLLRKTEVSNSINVADLPQGVYVLKVIKNGVSSTYKVPITN